MGFLWGKEPGSERKRRGRAAHRPADRIFFLSPAAGVVYSVCPLVPSPPFGQAGPRRGEEGAEAEPAFPWWPALFRPHRRRPSFCTCTPSSPSLSLNSHQPTTRTTNHHRRDPQTDASSVHKPTVDTDTTAHLRVLPAASTRRLCHASLFRASLSPLASSSLFFWASHFCPPPLSDPPAWLPIDILRLDLHTTPGERILCIDFSRPIYDAEHARVGSDIRVNRYRSGQPPPSPPSPLRESPLLRSSGWISIQGHCIAVICLMLPSPATAEAIPTSAVTNAL